MKRASQFEAGETLCDFQQHFKKLRKFRGETLIPFQSPGNIFLIITLANERGGAFLPEREC